MLSRRQLLLGLLSGAAGLACPTLAMRLDTDRVLEVAGSDYGEASVFAAREWLSLLESLGSEPARQQMEAVNRFFNEWVAWQDDTRVWGEEDYWATPLETLAAAAGDCEDFSIAKYVSLRLLGVANANLRLIYVNARLPEGNQAHMVLGHYETPASIPLVLDNIRTDILPASQRNDLLPVFSFNSEGIWVGGQARSAGDPTARLSRWRDVLRRLQLEGITP